MRLPFDEEAVKYNDDELVIIDDLREVSGFSARKIAFNMVTVCTSGKLSLDVAGQPVTVKAGQIFICHSHAVLSDYMLSPDFECKVMCISDRLLRNILQSQMLIWNKMLYRQRSCIVDMPPGRFFIYTELRYQYAHQHNPFKREILVSLLRVAFLELCEMLMSLEKEKKSEPVPKDNSSRMETIFHRFLENIARRHIKKLSVAEYADELFISPKYLSTVCRTVSGKSPLEWISEYVIEDVVYYLTNTDLTSKEISVELGFPNSSFFGKYVREHLGMTPYEYRRKLTDSWRQGNEG